MGIFTTREAAEEFVRGDPFVLNGVVRNWTIREWNEALIPDSPPAPWLVPEPDDLYIPNGPGDPDPAPASAPDGWRDIRPELSAEPYVFAAGELPGPPPGVSPFAVIREDEGVTLILTRADADRAGLAYEHIAARITLRVGSALTDVGLTALFSRTLAAAGISCNVIAGLAHDHLFVDWDQAARALALLREL
ncbi:MAG: ACT domain-containing protein [Streptosporangiaceae bacterium]